jgi:hypothetical protein
MNSHLKIMSFQWTLIVGSLLLSFVSRGAGADGPWPQWRGPGRDGVSTEKDLLKSWPADGPPLAWKATGIGAGYSGVSVVNGRVYTMGDGPDASYIYALDAEQGRILWAAKLGPTGGGGGYPGPRCTPSVNDGSIYALGQHGDLLCVEAATGKEIWRKNLVKDFEGVMMSDWGYAESPLVDADRVICTPGGPKGALIALNRKTGALLWRSREFTDPAAYASIVPVKISGVSQYVQLTGESVVGVNADNGGVLWRTARKGETAVIPTPVCRDHEIYVTSAYGAGCHMFRITTNSDTFSAEPVYASKAMANHHGGVILVGDYLYGHSEGKGWICQEFKTGTMVWNERTKLRKGSIAYADGHFYLRSESGKGTVALIEATPKGYIETGRFDQPDRSELNSWPPPVIAGARLYLRDQDLLLAYDIRAK